MPQRSILAPFCLSSVMVFSSRSLLATILVVFIPAWSRRMRALMLRSVRSPESSRIPSSFWFCCSRSLPILMAFLTPWTVS